MSAAETLVAFRYEEQALRTTIRDGAVWFVASDAAKILGHRDAAQVARITEADERGYAVVDTPGGPQQMLIVNESGLYAVVFRSRVEGAVAFRRWVTSEVIPSIRRTGSYAAPARELSRLEVIELARQSELGRLAAEERVAELAPAAAVAHQLIEAGGDYDLRDAAQILSRDHGIVTGRNRLAKHLRAIRWTDSGGDPYQRQIDAGRLARRTSSYDHPVLGRRVTQQVRITPKGLAWLHEHWPRPGAVAAP